MIVLKDIPNILTVARAALIPFVIVFYFLPFSWGNTVAASIFSAACLTDWLDGYLARRWGAHTKIGALLDPIADKILVVVVLVMLVYSYQSYIITISAIIIISREIIISALREWMAEIGQRNNIKVSILGKIKTLVQMVALIFLLANDPNNLLAYVGYILLVIAVLLTLLSMYYYLLNAKKYFVEISNRDNTL
jgi:CDP-diacylglycerol--glycerol-3-phosphate 3-phosphatidyltransferase